MASLPNTSTTGNNEQTATTRTASATEPQQPNTPTPVSTVSTTNPSSNTMAETKNEQLPSTSPISNNNKFLTSNPPLTFHRHETHSKRIYYTSAHQTSLRNSLLSLVGFLELANACDFAANVFNTIPVPTFAAALMGIGGCVALFFAGVAIQDARLSWRNICLLRHERRILLDLSHHTSTSKLDGEKASVPKTALKVYKDVNQFELLTEIIDRFLMDVTMGFGATLVGAGTLMAIGGANPRVFETSNLLSGYIGNSPAAAYGILRLFWSIYVWRRSSRHQSAARRQAVRPGAAFFRRYTRVKVYAFLAGPTSLVAGAASMITATRWEGYTVLVPCIVLSWVCNFLYRKEIGYTRPLFLLDGQSASAQAGQAEAEKDRGRVASLEFLQQLSLEKLLEEMDQTSLLMEGLEMEDASRKRERKSRARTSQHAEQSESKLEDGADCSVQELSAHRVLDLLTTFGLVEKFFKHFLSSSGTATDTEVLKSAVQTSSSSITIQDPQRLLSNLFSSLPIRFSNTLSAPDDDDNDNDNEKEDDLSRDQMHVQALDLARSILSSHGALHATYRQRSLIEFTGCWIHHFHGQEPLRDTE